MWWPEASAGTWDSMRPVKAEFETPRMVNLPRGHGRKNAIIRDCSRTEEEIRDLRKPATPGQKRIREEIYPIRWFLACIPELHK
jgi:hypothetical protein